VTVVVRNALLAGAAFVVMEPVAYAAHRWLMHGPGWVLHRSHHSIAPDGRSETARLWRHIEANDAFPVAFAGAAILTMAAGTRFHRLAPLVPLAAGVTAYGAAYASVHDGYIHRRVGRPMGLKDERRVVTNRGTVDFLERLRLAHVEHHRGGGEPYGMLFPLAVPRDLTPSGSA
jgi:beta-carotene 3-hydroxylase